jgi:hypothetical protein
MPGSLIHGSLAKSSVRRRKPLVSDGGDQRPVGGRLDGVRYFAFDLDDWDDLSNGQVEKILATQHHTKVHCTDIPNDGDQTLRGYEYLSTFKGGGGVWG